ncbi:YDG domain-containing protein [uncultured Draconibacterium sp.]|uniref:YDG domain-containing protein n=1 Tax=uncultured Draconibacterium sp. TaxID=1573823 RepID=UPI0029C7CA2E|nr:YDG domain-containing protein [uncultured Draconibacterium sp.]
MRTIFSLLKTVLILALFAASILAPGELSAQITNGGFESGTIGWTGSGFTTSTGETVLNWNIQPADGQMGRVTPGVAASTAQSTLGLTSSQLTGISSITNVGYVYQDINLTAGQEITIHWNYVSQDYSPYDDGTFACLTRSGEEQFKILARTFGTSDIGIPNTNAYGSTGWHTVSFTAGTTGTYRLGLGAFNWSDQAVSPILYIDDAVGGTSSPQQPVVSTSTPSNISNNSATVGGQVSSAGSGSVTDRGIVYSSSNSSPTIGNGTQVQIGTGLGSYSTTVSGLSNGVTYYVRAYATSSGGTSYGGVKQFTTLSESPPTVSTGSVSDINENSATGRVTVSADGGATITEYGVVYGTSSNPTTSNFKSNTTGAPTLGSEYSFNLTTLSANTTYYVRGFAINSAGTGYGTQTSFKTAPPVPVATAATLVGESSFKLNWNASTGAIKYYLDISTSSDFSSFISGYNNKDVGNVTSHNISGLSSGVNYYYRLRAYNGDATSGNSNTISTTTKVLDNFLVEAFGEGPIQTQTAGQSFNIRITARDDNNERIIDYVNNSVITSNGNLSDGSQSISSVTTGNFTGGVYSSQSVILTLTGDDLTITATKNEKTGISNEFTVMPGPINYYTIVANPDLGNQQQSVMAGVAFDVLVTVYDEYGNIKTDYDGDKSVLWETDATPSRSGDIYEIPEDGVQTFNSGVATIGSFVLYDAEEQPTITITDGPTSSPGTTSPILVMPNDLNNFTLEENPEQVHSIGGVRVTAGENFSVKVTARDVYQNVKRDYEGNIQFKSSNDLIVDYPNELQQFTLADNGVRVLTNVISIPTTGVYWLRAADSPLAYKTGDLTNIVVGPGAYSTSGSEFTATSATTGLTAGDYVNVSITPRDAEGNLLCDCQDVAIKLNGETYDWDSDPNPISVTDNHDGTYTAAIRITQLGTNTLTASVDGSDMSTTIEVVVDNPAAPSHFAIAGTGTQVAGVPQNITLTAYDEFHNKAVDYTGTKQIRFGGASDSNAPSTKPSVDGTDFNENTAIDFSGGEATVAMTLYKVESAEVTATDWTSGAEGITTPDDANDGVSPHKLPVVVSPAPADYLAITGSGTQEAGTSQNITLTAYDEFNNMATDYSGTKQIRFGGATPSDAPGVENPTVEAVDFGTNTEMDFTSGTVSVSMALFNAESAKITAADWTSGSEGILSPDDVIDGGSTYVYQLPVVVNATSPSYFAITGSDTQTAGVAQNITITMFDQYNNIATSYDGDKDLTFSGANASFDGINPEVSSTEFGNTTTVTFNNGVAENVSMSLFDAAHETQDALVNVSNGSQTATGQELTVDVIPNNATKLRIDTQPSIYVRAGDQLDQQPVISVRDAYGNMVDDNTTTVTATANGTESLVGTTEITAVNGIVTFTDLSYQKMETITIEFDANPALTTVTSGSILVDHNATVKYVYSTTPPYIYAGGQRGAYTVKRYDTYDNLVNNVVNTDGSDGNGDETVYLYSDNTDTNTKFYDVATGGSALTSVPITDGATSVNFWYYSEKEGDHLITASDKSSLDAPDVDTENATNTLEVKPAALSHFVVSGVGTSTNDGWTQHYYGDRQTVTVEAIDIFGNRKINYAGTVTFSLTDAEANEPGDAGNNYPVDYTFALADGGIHTFDNAILFERPSFEHPSYPATNEWWVTVVDLAQPSKYGSQVKIEVLKRPITVTAHNQTKQYYGDTYDLGSTQFTVTSGITAYQDPDVFAGTEGISNVTLSSDGTGASALAGDYQIVPSNVVGINDFNENYYDITFEDGTLSIDPRPITITVAANQSKTYGDVDPSGYNYTVTEGSLASGDVFSGNLTREAGEDVGLYEVYQTGLTIKEGATDKTDNYDITFVNDNKFAITKRDLTLANFVADDKVYDGNTDVLSGDAFDDDRVAGDVLTFAYDIAFEDKNVGVAKDVYFSGIQLSGSNDDANYNLVTLSGTANADITKRDLALSNFVADNKVYDGSTDVISGDGFDDDRVAGDVLAFAYDMAFENKNVGVAKDVNFTSIAISGGDDKDNYNLVTLSGTANADITKRDLALSNFVADNKVYDGNTDVISGDAFDDDRVAGDVLTFTYNVAFDNKNVGTEKDVDFTSMAISGGDDKDNYNLLTGSGTANADITKRDLALSNFVADNKVYDGNTDVISGDAFDDDRVAGDVLTFAYDVAFDNKNVGVAKDVDFTSIAISGGDDKDNYNLVTLSGTANADITKRDLALSNFVADNKVYDGNTDVISGDGFDDDRVAGDVLAFAYDIAFDNKNVGVAKDVDFTSIAISGGDDKDNYNLLTLSGTTNADITKRDLALSNFVADNKVYDGNTDVISGDGFDDDRVAGDVLAFAYDVAFDNKNVGTEKDVDFTSIAISGGDDKDNYNLLTGSGTANADITKRDLSLSNFIADNKVYDGNTDVLSGDGFDDDRVAGDVLAFAYDVAFDNKNVGVAKDVDFTSIAISGGNDKDNYNLVTLSGTTNADITKRDLALSNFVADNKVYDGNTDVISGDGFDDDRVAGDVLAFAYDVAFDNKNVGVAKDVDFSSIAISGGDDKDNYNLLTLSGTANADITKRDLALSNFVADNKVYDGNTDVLSGDAFDDDRVAGDVLTFAYDVAFDNKNVGVAKDVDFTSIAISGGDDKDNYNLVTLSGTTNADITKRDLALSNFVADNKVYDGNTDVISGDGFDDDRVAGDVLAFAYDVAFDNKNVGVAKDVDFSSIAISGGDDKDNYNLLTLSGTANADITKRDLALSNFVADNKVYDGNTDVLSGDAFDDDRVAGDVLTFAYDVAFDNKNVGVGKDVDFSSIAISGGDDKDNYNLATTSGTANADITKRDLALSNFVADNKVYDGNTDVISGDGFDDDRVAGDVLAFAYDMAFENKNVGVAKDVDFSSIAISGGDDKDNYNLVTLSGTANADITKRDLALSNFVADNKAYDGNTDVISGDGFDDDRVAGDVLTFAYDVAFDNKNVGTEKDVDFTSIAISGGDDKDNYNLVTLGGTANADITKRDLALSNFVADNKVYDGNTDVISGDGFDDDRVAGDVLTFAYDVAFDNKNVGIAKDVDFTSIAISGGDDKDNYNLVTLSGTANADITPLDVTVTADSDHSKIYGETDPVFTYTSVPELGSKLTDTEVIEFTGELGRVAGENVGIYALTQGTLDNVNYNITFASNTFEITKRRVAVAADAYQSKTYGDLDPVFTYASNPVLGSKLPNNEVIHFDGELIRTEGENVGLYAIEQGTLDNSNYEITFVSNDFEITTLDVTVTVDADQSKTYGDLDPVFEYTSIPAVGVTLANNEVVGFAGELDRAAGEDIGLYAIGQGTLDNPNYSISFMTDNFEITKLAVTVTADADQSKTYGDLDPVFEYTSIPAVGATLSNGKDVSFAGELDRAAGEDVGLYAIGQGTLANPNYSINFMSDNFEITKLEVTVTTDADQSKTYGELDPVFEYTSIPAVGATLTNSEVVGFAGELDRAAGEDVGLYAIGQGTLANPNYSINFITDNFEITKLEVTVTADADQSKTYGEADPEVFTYSSSPEIGSTLANKQTIGFTGGLIRAEGENTGSYEINLGTLSNSNYNIAYISDIFEITTKALTITAGDKTKEYDGEVYSPFTVSYDGFVNDEDESVLEGALTFSGTAANAVNAGTDYVITPEGLTSSNYEITYVDGLLDITAKSLTITADNKSKIYDGEVYSPFTVSYDGFIGSENESNLDGELTFSGSAVNATEVGADYIITPEGFTSSNYEITYVSGSLIIVPHIVGDTNGDGIIGEDEITGDINGDGIISDNEITGDIDGDGIIGDGEIAGDTNGDGVIDENEIAGDTNGDGQMTDGEISGDINGDGQFSENEVAGDIDGNGNIGGNEVAGDANGDGFIDASELAGDTNGDGSIGGSEIAGDTNGDGVVDIGEISGDANGDGQIGADEIAGDRNGDGNIAAEEIAGDIDGNGSISGLEIIGDNDGDGQISYSEIAGDANGDGIIGAGEARMLDPNKDHINIMKLFTPNNDGFNDYWKIYNILELGRVQVKIYDRYGTLVYESSAYQNDWDGTSKGESVPEGGYIYHVKTERAGNTNGVVNIVR